MLAFSCVACADVDNVTDTQDTTTTTPETTITLTPEEMLEAEALHHTWPEDLIDVALRYVPDIQTSLSDIRSDDAVVFLEMNTGEIYAIFFEYENGVTGSVSTIYQWLDGDITGEALYVNE
jgi:hypothetical protein